MEAGKQLDALVAEKIFGYKVFRRDYVDGARFFFEDTDGAPTYLYMNYSTDIAAAWEVVEKLRELNNGSVLEFRLTWSGKEYGIPGFVFRIWESDLPHVDLLPFEAKTAPHAICLAALKAVGVNL